VAVTGISVFLKLTCKISPSKFLKPFKIPDVAKHLILFNAALDLFSISEKLPSFDIRQTNDSPTFTAS
jgi:hypothetical protein